MTNKNETKKNLPKCMPTLGHKCLIDSIKAYWTTRDTSRKTPRSKSSIEYAGTQKRKLEACDKFPSETSRKQNGNKF